MTKINIQYGCRKFFKIKVLLSIEIYIYIYLDLKHVTCIKKSSSQRVNEINI